MGDWFQVLVAPDVTAAEAEATGKRMLGWLIAEEIVCEDTKDCVLSAELGYPPGPCYAKATVEEYPAIFRQWTNGLSVICKRTVFYSCGGGSELLCPTCKSTVEPEGWGRALGEWFDQTGSAEVVCPVCGVSRRIVDWQFDPPWGFGELGFEFWNWPSFTKEFIDAFEKQLGSRIVYVCGDL